MVDCAYDGRNLSFVVQQLLYLPWLNQFKYEGYILDVIVDSRSEFIWNKLSHIRGEKGIVLDLLSPHLQSG